MQQLIPPCPHCNKSGMGFIQKQQTHGWIELFFWDNSEHDMESSLENLVFGRRGPIRCAGCFKIRNDVRVEIECNREFIVSNT